MISNQYFPNSKIQSITPVRLQIVAVGLHLTCIYLQGKILRTGFLFWTKAFNKLNLANTVYCVIINCGGNIFIKMNHVSRRPSLSFVTNELGKVQCN